MPNNELPQRDPLVGPPPAYTITFEVGEARAGESATELFGQFVAAVREWAGPPPASTESSRWRGDEPPAIGRTTPPSMHAEV